MEINQLIYRLFGLFFLRFWRIGHFWKGFVIPAVLWFVIAGAGFSRLYASCITLDDLPLDVEQQQAPGILMFLIDNSGSMDWEVLVQGTEQGYYVDTNPNPDKNYPYVFKDAGDNGNVGGSDTIEENIPTQWKSQWSGYNHMYYDPSVTYTPWPTFSDADKDNPRSNPVSSTDTMSLSGVFHDFGEPPISDIALQNAGAIFVDNLDTATAQGIIYSPNIIMDTADTVNDSLWNSAEYGSVSFSAGGGPAWSCTPTANSAFPYGDSSTGLTDKHYCCSSTNTTGFPNAKSKTYTATWSFTNIVAGVYDVYAWWPSVNNAATSAKYSVDGSLKATLDQTSNAQNWNLVASDVTLASSATVSVSQTNGTSGLQKLLADAVKIVPKFSTTPPIMFEKTGPSTGGNVGWSPYCDANAYRGYYDTCSSGTASYYYTNAVGNFTATWYANNLKAGQAYDVYARWAQGGDNRYNAVPYKTYYGTSYNSSQTTPVDQTQTLGYWTKIASNCTCTDGKAKVVLSRTTTSSSQGRACADAVAFVTAGGFSIKMHRAHYFVQKPDPITPTQTDTYLVDIDGGSIKYYRYIDDGDNLIEMDEITKLTDAQAAAAGIVTGRTYTKERQNFANYISYYRRRMLTAKNAVASVMDTIQGVYVGFITINQPTSGTYNQYIKPVRVNLETGGVDAEGNKIKKNYDESANLMSKLFAVSTTDSTPLRGGLDNVGKYFQGGYNKSDGMAAAIPTDYFDDNSYPYFISDKGGSCQQAFCIVMTDGYWNSGYSGTTVGDADTDISTTQMTFADGTRTDGGKFADSVTKVVTMADIAMYYYENDLNNHSDGKLYNFVPTNATDSAFWQHMVTYTLSFGLTGTINQSLYPNCPAGTCPTWPQGSFTQSGHTYYYPLENDPTTVDDLWHAAVNGRGKYINASNPMDLVAALNVLKEDIENRLGSAASMATSAIERQVGTKLYQGTYNTAGWFGEVKSVPIDVTTGAIVNCGMPPFADTNCWLASEDPNLKQISSNWANRNILSYDGTHGIKFEYGNISSAQETQLQATYSYDAAQVVDFIRGDTSHNVSHGGDLRVRTKPLGDFVHSTPCFYEDMLYIGGNDGMLHAFDATNGHEIFCYVPAMVYDHLANLAYPSYSHKYYVDGSPAVGKADNGHDILVCGLGKGGKGYFALDVTHPNSMTVSNVLWEAPAATDDDMGYSFSNPIIVNTKAAGKVVVFGNGYDSVNQKAVLYVVNLTSGATIAKLNTEVAGCNGLSTPSVIDTNGAGYVDYAFAGDLLGNIWKFDLRGTLTTSGVPPWKVYYWDTTADKPKPLISVKNGSDVAQTITDAPEIMFDCATSDFASSGQGLMVIFGTGRYLNGNDISNKDPQSLYGIWDWGNIWEKRSSYDVAKTKYLGATSGTTRTLSNVSGKTLLQQTETSTGSHIFTSNTVQWYNPLAASGSQGQHMGWFYDLTGTGERVFQDPYLRKGVAIFVSLIPSESPCEAGGSSRIYMINACNGGHTAENQFLDRTDHVDYITPPGEDGPVFKPIEISNVLYFSNAAGGASAMNVPHNVLGVQYWLMLQ